MLIAALAALTLSWLPAPSDAEEPAAAAPGATAKVKEEVKEAREKVREAAKQAREKVIAAKQEARESLEAARGEAREKMKVAKEEMKAAHEDVKVKLGAAREELREQLHEKVDQVLGPPLAERAARAREHRRNALRAMHPHWRRGADIPPQAREALRRHARRTARLLRIRALAEAAGDAKSVERCDKLLELERSHHQARMGRLIPKRVEGAAPAAAPVAPHQPEEGEADEPAAEEEAEDQP